MATNGSASLRKSSTAVNNRSVLKKGPWTVSEDTILVEYVKKHGEGNWNAVQRNSGLMRCGKSCRLRWANHLRPNLKKGAFSVDEERLIVELHAKLGNKWARMAAQLPGRTDNEIKNYWNTRFKRRQRAGLPIYPQEVCQEFHHLSSSSPPHSMSSFLPFSNNNHPTNPAALCFFDNFKTVSSVAPASQNLSNTSFTEHDLRLFQGSGGGLSLSLAATNSAFVPSSMGKQSIYDLGYHNSMEMVPLLEYNSSNFGVSLCHDMGILELPSIQTTMQPTDAAPAISSSDGEHQYKMENEFSREKNSGLLEDLLGQSQALKSAENTNDKSFLASHERNEAKFPWDFSMIEYGEAENLQEKSDFSVGHGSSTSENNYDGPENKAEAEAINGAEDEIFNLLDSFPLAVPIPDWNEGLTKCTSADIKSEPPGQAPLAHQTKKGTGE